MSQSDGWNGAGDAADDVWATPPAGPPSGPPPGGGGGNADGGSGSGGSGRSGPGFGSGILLVGLAVLVLVGAGAVGYLLAGGGDDDEEAVTTTVTAAETTTTVEPTTSVAPATTESTTTTSEVPLGFPELFEANRAAVARVDVVGCSFGGQGTAFLVEPDRAITAWHVVDGAAQVAVSFGDQVVDATVIGFDLDRDVALLSLATPVTDIEPLDVSDRLPRVGEEVAAMGHPRGQPLALTVGRVTSMNGSFDFGTPEFPIVVEDLIQTDAVVAPGNSGGPLIDDEGDVVGVVVLRDGFGDGLMWATDIQSTIDEIEGWSSTPEIVEAAFCLGEIDLDAETGYLVDSDVDHPEVEAIERTYGFYAFGINSGRAIESYEVLGPSLQARFDPESWAAGQETSFVWSFWIRDVREVEGDPDALDVRIAFTSTQAPEFGRVVGETCTRWDLTHRLVRGEVRGEPFWLIDDVETGDAISSCDDYQPDPVDAGLLSLPGGGASEATAGRLSWGTVDRWMIDLAEGDEIAIEVVALDGAFDPVLRVVDSSGLEIGFNDDRGDGSLDSEITGLVITSTDTYTIEIRDYNDAAAGEYRLTLTG